MTFSPKRQTSFDQAVEAARLAYLESQELISLDLPTAPAIAYERLAKTYQRAARRQRSNVTKQVGKFYDLEFCLWLQHNFDYLLQHHQEFPGFKLWQGVGEQ